MPNSNPLGIKRLVSGTSISFKCECYIIKQIQYVDLNVHMNLFQGDSDQRFVIRIWLDYEKQNECE